MAFEETRIEMEKLNQGGEITSTIIRAVEHAKLTGDNTDILDILKNKENKINLGTHIEEGLPRRRTILRKILEDTVNGNKIVKAVLDQHVSELNDHKDSVNYALQIDYQGIFSEDPEDQNQMEVVSDLMDLRANKAKAKMYPIADLLKHPVIALFIAGKYQKAQWYYSWKLILYFLFLIFYSWFIYSLFSPTVDGTVDIQNKTLSSSQKDPDASMTKNFLEENPLSFTLFIIFFILQTVHEVYFAIRQKMLYFVEQDNYWVWFAQVSALLALIYRDSIADDATFIRGLTAIGICVAWLVLFFLGKYPFSGGDFSIMFYNVIRKLFRYAFALLYMIFAFGFAFMVVSYNQDKEKAKGFANPLRSSIFTLEKTLGEFNLDDFYEIFNNDPVSRGFAIFLMSVLIWLGAIAMVNLFVAVIISNINELQDEVYTQTLINMAKLSIQMEKILPSCVLDRIRVDDTTIICMHEICNKGCKGQQELPRYMKNVFKQLQQIVKKEEDKCENEKK